MRLNVCFNDMAPFGPCAAFVEGFSTLHREMAEMEVRPQEEMANSQCMTVFAVERHWLPEDFMSIHALCGVKSSPLVFSPNRPIVWGPLRWQAPI